MSILNRLKRAIFDDMTPEARDLVDLAVLAIIKDCAIHDDERASAVNLLLSLPWFQGIERAALEGAIEEAIGERDFRQSHSALTARIARRFDDPDAREVVLGIAAFVVLADGHLDEREAAWLEQLTKELGMGKARLDEIVADVREFLKESPGGYPAPPPQR